MRDYFVKFLNKGNTVIVTADSPVQALLKCGVRHISKSGNINIRVRYYDKMGRLRTYFYKGE